MSRRVHQLIAALTARIEDEDRKFIGRWLPKREQKLFWAMNLPDQYHTLYVCRTALRLAEGEAMRLDRKKLIECCLLHDVGKVRGDVSTIDKILTVIAHKIAPQWSERWGVIGKGGLVKNLRHAFYIYFHHAERSYDKLLAIGRTDLAEIVLKHHKAPAEDDPPELVVLRKADDLN